MAKREPELNGSRELIDYLNGDGPFSQKLVLEIVQLKSAYAHIYEGLQTLNRLGGTRHAELLGAIDGMRRKNQPTRAERDEQWHDDGEITDVTDREALRERARVHRARDARNKRIAKWLAGPVLVVGGIVWELIRAYVSR
jgi:hypothetical protein